ncbi:WAT1-related protein At1g21890-like [Phalaenopsis equestris]|uniref:WAT1-related protein At1g21890-like n=1 Tax=Phalaenopsis equestris TaxID=78828 RepID=UPI0009E2EDDD|nr:WAT1-related protein At1g21890-like [Phalaenopsis equestris]
MAEVCVRATMNRLKPYILMIFLQFGYAGMYVISIVSLKKGINHFVLVVYRNAVAVAAIAPFAIWLERKGRPKMTPRIFIKILIMALLEPVLDQNMYYVGTVFTSASFTAALVNILPAITFLMAFIIGVEKVKIKSRRSQAKIIGTLVTVAGAILMIMYKGAVVDLPWTRGSNQHVVTDAGTQNERHWIMGTFMLLGSCTCWAAFFILQANTLKSYPAELSLATLICTMGMIESASVALVMERGLKPWLIGFDTRIFAALYSGIVCSGVTYYIQGIVMKERGPVFVTAFQPLCMIIVVVLGSIILAEKITVGTMTGAIIIVIGLYFLIWGKAKDHLIQSSQKLPNVLNDTKKPATIEKYIDISTP